MALLLDHYMIPEVIGIWGGGLIGLSTAAHYARKGVKCIIYDIDTAQVSRINNKVFPFNFEGWLGFSVTDFIDSGSIRATADLSELSRGAALVKTHFIAVATERNGEPYMDNLQTVLRQIVELSPDLCVIESTVVPGQIEGLHAEYNIPLGVATRRDWFTPSENNLENCVRVYAGIDDKVSERMQAILSIVCKKLARASSCTVVELTKCLDNGIFHTTAMYASQVASAYPNADVTESLRLVATHWRLGNHVYFPSLGTGGHCVPLANKYLLSGALHPNRLAIASEALRYDTENPSEVATLVHQQLKGDYRVAVLGIYYRGDIRVHIESPHLKFARALMRLGVQIGIHDPYYTDAELTDITGGTPFKFPEDLKEFQFIYIGANHAVYTTRINSVLAFMRQGQSILDNQGVWEALADDAQSLGISYHRVGGAQWLPLGSDDPKSVTGNDLTKQQSKNIVFKTKWFQIYTIPDPRSLSPDPYYIFDRADSATIIPFSPTGRFLLQKQYRAHTGCNSWEFPMGFIDRGESPKEAAKRELFEETSLTCESMRLLGCYYPLPGLTTQRMSS